MIKKTVVLLAVLATAIFASAGTITFGSNYQLLGSYTTNGLLNWDPNWTWNGTYQKPPDYVLQLSSTINLYTELTNSHTLFVQVEDVVSGHAGTWFGAAWTAVTMTGVSLQDSALSSLSPVYSGQYANTGEYLEGTPTGECSQSQNIPLDSTPGWNLTAPPGGFLISTINTPNNGFTSGYGCIWGGFRIINGGVFALDFGKNLNDIDLKDLTLAAVYGDDRQTIVAQPVAEPGTVLIMLGSGMFGLAGMLFRRLRT